MRRAVRANDARRATVVRRAAVPLIEPPYPGPRGTGRLAGSVKSAETRYAKSGDVHIAYRVFGEGPPDIVLVPAPPPALRAVFRREGDYWTVSWRGNVVRLKHAKGLQYIAYLLAHPGRQVLASDLAAAGTAGGNPTSAPTLTASVAGSSLRAHG